MFVDDALRPGPATRVDVAKGDFRLSLDAREIDSATDLPRVREAARIIRISWGTIIQ